MSSTSKKTMSRRNFVAGSATVGAAVLASRVPFAFAQGSQTGSAASPEQKEQTYKPGIYTASFQGHSDLITVEVTVSEHTIDDIQVTECRDTGFIAQHAIDQLPSEMIKYQTYDVDTVTGATLSSNAIRNAVSDCLTQAGADTDSMPSKPDPEQVDGKDEERDVLVVGSGPSGMLAAFNAASADGTSKTSSGLDVLIIEQLAFPGGSFLYSGAGILALYGDLPHESGECNPVSEDAFVKYLRYRSDDDDQGILNEPLMRSVYQSLWPASQLVMELGGNFDSDVLYGGPMGIAGGKEYEDGDWLMLALVDDDGTVIAGNEAPIADLMGPSWVGMFDNMPSVEKRCLTEAVSLIVEDDEVKGVNVKQTDPIANTITSYAIKAKKVVLATGSPNLNTDLLEKYSCNLMGAWTFCGAGSKGAGITMVQDAGFEPQVVGQGGMCYAAASHEYGMEDGLVFYMSGFPYVNKEGKRFFDESTIQYDQGGPIQEQTDGVAYMVFDSGENFNMGTVPAHFNNNDGKVLADYGVEKGWMDKAETLDDIPALIGVPEDAFKQTMDDYTSAAAGKADDEFGCAPETMHVPSVPPFYVVHASACRTEAYIGVRTAEGSVAVLDGKGSPIPNLYGAGTYICPNIYYHHYFQGCGGLGTAIATGFLAGREVRESLLNA